MLASTSSVTGTMVIVGASRGIGAAMARRYRGKVGSLVTVSRSPSEHGRWIRCDVADPVQVNQLAAEIGSRPLDALLILSGVWEDGAFGHGYRFEASPAEEIECVLRVNLLAPILLVQALRPALRLSANPRVVVMGSLSGTDGGTGPEVAYSASKHGLRGALQAMAPALRDEGIGLTLINPGTVATPEVLGDVAAGRLAGEIPIPMDDLAAVIDCALAMSSASVMTEVNLAQRRSGLGR